MTTQVTIGYEHGKAVAGMKEFASEADRTGGRLDHLQGDIRDVQAITELFGKEAGETAALILRMSGSVGQAQKSFEQYMIANAKASGALKNFGKEAANAAGSIGGTDLTLAALTKRFLTFEAAKQIVGSGLNYLNKQFQMTADEGVEPFQLSLEYAWGQLDKLATGTNNWQIERTNEKLKAATEKRKQMVLEEEKAYKALIEDFNKQVMGKAAEDRAKSFAEGFKDLPQIAEARKAEIDHVRRLADEGKLTEEIKAQGTAKVVALDQRRDELLQKQKDSVKAAADLESAMVESVRKDRLAAGVEQLKTLDQVREYEQAMVQRAKDLAEAHRFDEKAQKAFATEMAVLEERKNKIQQEGEEAKKKASDEAKEAAKREVDLTREKHQWQVKYVEAAKESGIFSKDQIAKMEEEERRLLRLRTDLEEKARDEIAKTNAERDKGLQKQIEITSSILEGYGKIRERQQKQKDDTQKAIDAWKQSQMQAAQQVMGTTSRGGSEETGSGDVVRGRKKQGPTFGFGALASTSGQGFADPIGRMLGELFGTGGIGAGGTGSTGGGIIGGMPSDADIAAMLGLDKPTVKGLPGSNDAVRYASDRRKEASRARAELKKRLQTAQRDVGGRQSDDLEVVRLQEGFGATTQAEKDLIAQANLPRMRKSMEDARVKEAMKPFANDRTNRGRQRAMRAKEKARRQFRMDSVGGRVSRSEEAKALQEELNKTSSEMKKVSGTSEEVDKALNKLGDNLEKVSKSAVGAAQMFDSVFRNVAPGQQPSSGGGGRPFNRAAAQQAGRGG